MRPSFAILNLGVHPERQRKKVSSPVKTKLTIRHLGNGTRRIASGVAIYGALGHVPPGLPTIAFLVHFGIKLTAKYCVVREIS